MNSKYTKFLFFTGKGGVGKTTLACATAIKLADEGKKVLLISTDPASNLEDVLAFKVGNQIKPHPELPNLFTVNINPTVASEEYRSRAIEPLRDIATAKEIERITEQLSGACTTEIASFDEFSRFVTGEDDTTSYDHLIFDTAPTGHTIRLLELPAAWDTFLDQNPKGATCVGPSSALKSSKKRYKKVVANLRDAYQTTFYLVARADYASLKEAAKTSQELVELGMRNQKLLINGIFSALDKTDALALKMEQIAEKELHRIPQALSTLETQHFPLLPYNTLGIEKLRSLLNTELQKKIITQEERITPKSNIITLSNIKTLVDDLENNKQSGLIMTLGKGGVGKTIVATTIATMLAKRGHKVLLTTTDPASHLNDFMGQLNELPKSLTVERINPKTETQNYTDKVMRQKGMDLNEEGKKLLLEDLQSPCTEEVAVFHAFSKAICKAKHQFVVIDTAPTGHTLLLLDKTGSYHREVLRNTIQNSGKITTPYMSLQNPDFAKLILITLPETTPMREAEELQNDLKRSGIIPYAWVINQCLSILENIKDPILKKRALDEEVIIQNIESKLANRTFGIPYLPEEMLLPEILTLYDKNKIQA